MSEEGFSDYLCVQRFEFLHLFRSQPIRSQDLLQLTTTNDSKLKSSHVSKQTDWSYKEKGMV